MRAVAAPTELPTTTDLALGTATWLAAVMAEAAKSAALGFPAGWLALLL